MYKHFKYRGQTFVLDAYGDGDESIGIFELFTPIDTYSGKYKVRVLLYSEDFDTVDNREQEYIEFFYYDDWYNTLFYRNKRQPSAYKIWCHLSSKETKLFNRAKERLYRKLRVLVPEPVMCKDKPYAGGEFIKVDTDCLKDIKKDNIETRSGKEGVYITVHQHFEKYHQYRDKIKNLLDSTSDDPTVQNFQKLIDFFKGIDEEWVEHIKPYTLFVHLVNDWYTKYFITEQELEKEKNRLRVLQPIDLELDVINSGYFRGR